MSPDDEAKFVDRLKSDPWAAKRLLTKSTPKRLVSKLVRAFMKYGLRHYKDALHVVMRFKPTRRCLIMLMDRYIELAVAYANFRTKKVHYTQSGEPWNALSYAMKIVKRGVGEEALERFIFVCIEIGRMKMARFAAKLRKHPGLTKREAAEAKRNADHFRKKEEWIRSTPPRDIIVAI